MTEEIESLDFRKLFIKDLNFETTEYSLKTYFEQWGEITDYRILRHVYTGKSRGFGFITYRRAHMVDDAQAARPHVIDGHRVRTRRYLPLEYFDKPENRATAKEVYVRGSTEDLDEEYLREYFGRYGNIVHVNVVTDKKTGRKKGFAFVEFDDYDPVDKIILLRHNYMGIKLKVEKSLSYIERTNTKMEEEKGGFETGRCAYGRGEVPTTDETDSGNNGGSCYDGGNGGDWGDGTYCGGYGVDYGYEGYGVDYGYEGYGVDYGYEGYGVDYGYEGYGVDYGYEGYGVDYGYGGYGVDYGYGGYGVDYGYGGYGVDYGYGGYGVDYGYGGYGVDYGYGGGYLAVYGHGSYVGGYLAGYGHGSFGGGYLAVCGHGTYGGGYGPGYRHGVYGGGYVAGYGNTGYSGGYDDGTSGLNDHYGDNYASSEGGGDVNGNFVCSYGEDPIQGVPDTHNTDEV